MREQVDQICVENCRLHSGLWIVAMGTVRFTGYVLNPPELNF